MLMTLTPKATRNRLGRDMDLLPPRYYDTTLGRFTSLDTYEGRIADPLTLQRYAYAQSDPVNIVDPSGHDGESLTSQIVVSGIQSGLAGIAIGAPFRAYRAARQLQNGIAVREVLREAAFGALTDFGIGFAFGAGFRALKLLQVAEKLIQQGVGPVFSRIRAASSALRPGTQIPTYFELSTDAGLVFVKNSATKHIPEIVQGVVSEATKAGAVNSAGLTRFASGLILESLETAITKALQTPNLLLDTPIVVEGWELIIGEATTAGLLRTTVYHAVPKAIGL